ncbi:phosphatidylinositol transfer protein Csr1p [[Candida] railenensis]|uniref:Phosphatidylinositol transfer protein Csr1p n=1 Tax=[Candida] railenensis TaxID=45579 RepID=A0A9P0QKF8_9ASCO|nr:phosphatidylinositol transfer protein Csr1p [[Candida] railenensis]
MPSTDRIRPGRIQTLSPEQEIAYKQVLGYLLRYWGYDLNMPVADLGYSEAFVSSSTNANNKTIVDAAVLVANGATEPVQQSKKKGWGSWVKGGNGDGGSAEAPQSKRILKVQSKKTEKYKPIKISDQHRYTYSVYYNQGDYFNRDYESDDSTPSSYSNASIETAVTNLTLDDDSKIDTSPPHKGKSLNAEELTCKPKSTILPVLSNYKGKDIHGTFWKMQRADLLDNWILRFVRARNFDVEKALGMFSKDLDWKTNECLAYEWLLEGDAPSYIKGVNPTFVKNFDKQKAYINGRDKKGNIIFGFRAALHLTTDANPQEEMRRWSVCMIEWCRYYFSDIQQSKDQASVIFDLTGFSLKNADYSTIKFIADVFEAHYPECLEKIFIFNAPWIFQTMWNIIKGWFDPVVASKITFVKDISEITEFIDISQIPSFMGGEAEYELDYPVPTKADAQTKPKDSKFQQLIKERDELNLQYLDRTARWIESYDPQMSSKYLEERINVSIKLAKNYAQLDPYIRKRGVVDRIINSTVVNVS